VKTKCRTKKKNKPRDVTPSIYDVIRILQGIKRNKLVYNYVHSTLMSPMYLRISVMVYMYLY